MASEANLPTDFERIGKSLYVPPLDPSRSHPLWSTGASSPV